MGSTLVIIGLIPLLVLIGIAAGAPLIILGLRQRAALRRAGVNADNPGCTRCLYIMRGWDSSICPECGVDVRQGGARVGVHHNRFLKCLVALVASSILTAVILWLVCGWLFAIQVDYDATRFVTSSQATAAGYAPFEIQLQTERVTRRLPKHTSAQSALVIDPNQTLGPMHISATTQWGVPVATMMKPTTGDDSSNFRVLYVAADDQPPTEQDILDLVNESLELDAAQAAVLAKEIYTLTVNHHARAPSTRFTPSILSNTGGGSGQFKGIWWPAQMVMWVGTIVTTLTFVIWVFRRHRPGIRAVDEGEWARTAPDREAEPI